MGPLISMKFFYGGIQSRVPRDLGPYANEYHYASALTDVALQKTQAGPTTRFNRGPDRSLEILEAIGMLRSVLDIVFSQTDPHHGTSCTTMTFHSQNILVDLLKQSTGSVVSR